MAAEDGGEATDDGPVVQVLLGTFNGAAHLGAQLESIARQDHPRWRLRVSDDGSSDGTRAILAAFAAAHPGRVTVGEGPRAGSAANYLALLADPSRPPGPVALADQDDVWHPFRLSRGLAQMRAGAEVVAAMTTEVDEALRPLGPSRWPARPPAFANALVQNVLAGNTLMADAGAAELLRRAAPLGLAAGVRHHDWWVYLVATGAGRRVLVDREPVLLYRQHRANTVGAPRGLAAAWGRAAALPRGVWRDWIGRNLAALEPLPDLTPEARALLARFREAREARSPRGRLRAVRALGVHRQTQAQDAALAVSALAGWL